MPELNELSKTLYIPLVGRIYASRHYPSMIHDPKAIGLESSLPADAATMNRGQNEYTMVASVARSVNMDRRIRQFLAVHPDAAVISVGCGLETTYWRCDNGRALWFELDLPEVINVRGELLSPGQRQVLIPGDMFDYSWIERVKEYSERPTIVVVSGVFYYFEEDRVIDFINHLAAFEAVRVVFDSTSSKGLKLSQAYVKRMKNGSTMHFSVDDPRQFVGRLTGGARLVEHVPYYRDIERRGVGLIPRAYMRVSDMFHMVSMTIIDMGRPRGVRPSGPPGVSGVWSDQADRRAAGSPLRREEPCYQGDKESDDEVRRDGGIEGRGGAPREERRRVGRPGAARDHAPHAFGD